MRIFFNRAIYLSLGFLFLYSFPLLSQNNNINIKFIDSYFENASPVTWAIQGDTIVKISLIPDYERETLNRQTDHWNFKIEAPKGTTIKFILSKQEADIYNGRLAKNWWNFEHGISCYVSYDQKSWTPIHISKLSGHELLVEMTMEENFVYVANIPPYTLSDLENLKQRIESNHRIKIITIGETVEKRPLEIIRLGNPKAQHSILIRARAHPWEPGGNWVIEGLINKFLEENSKKWLEAFCIYIMPMANKDGVVRGMTRFNVRGKDLNRNWDVMADTLLCPEKYALEKFIEELIKTGKKPCFAIDIHNDDYGKIHAAHCSKGDKVYLDKLHLFESLMREHTSFSEGVKYSWETKNSLIPASTFQNGLSLRYGIDAIVYELNANWIASLGKVPEAKDWMEIGANLNQVFYEFANQLK
ncbi:peptidase M14 [Mariniphaga sediminis]|uniref:Peptidase M14 n=1 Tax=Mariniphaga sediminis TaxID=1628158 RepID=A0A399D5N2_9BACT|nr:M14 family zinc carboxypeptidase [Mariniphaga sediminis]RIH67194.1 peptidase M14 [Mariniphaga sediminis]